MADQSLRQADALRDRLRRMRDDPWNGVVHRNGSTYYAFESFDEEFTAAVEQFRERLTRKIEDALCQLGVERPTDKDPANG